MDKERGKTIKDHLEKAENLFEYRIVEEDDC
jgi:hypothetical protein